MSDKFEKTSEVFKTSEVSARAILPQALADQRERARRGEPLPVEAYLEQHPALRADPEALLDLIYQEMMLRESAGATPVLAEYVARFPALTAELRIQFEIEQAIEPDQDAQTLVTERRRLLGDDGPIAPPIPRPPACDFELLDDLGRPMVVGVDRKGRQRSLNRIVNLKLLSTDPLPKEGIARLRIEVEAIARLQHPNIAQVFEIGILDGKLWLVAEHFAAASLAQRLDRPWPPPQAARLVETLARAVHYAHQQGIVHGDLKPANIQFAHAVSPAPLPKITDFGWAKIIGPHAGDPRTDVQALGAILRQLLGGGQSSPETPPIPHALDAICDACLHPDLRHRYASALRIADDLHRFQTGQPIHARPTLWTQRLLQPAERHPLLTALAILIALAAIIFATLAW